MLQRRTRYTRRQRAMCFKDWHSPCCAAKLIELSFVAHREQNLKKRAERFAMTTADPSAASLQGISSSIGAPTPGDDAKLRQFVRDKSCARRFTLASQLSRSVDCDRRPVRRPRARLSDMLTLQNPMQPNHDRSICHSVLGFSSWKGLIRRQITPNMIELSLCGSSSRLVAASFSAVSAFTKCGRSRIRSQCHVG